MSTNWWLFVALCIVLGALAIILVSATQMLPHRKRKQRAESIRRAEESFHRQREWLEVRFLKLASQSGKPRGLRWWTANLRTRSHLPGIDKLSV